MSLPHCRRVPGTCVREPEKKTFLFFVFFRDLHCESASVLRDSENVLETSFEPGTRHSGMVRPLLLVGSGASSHPYPPCQS